MAMVLFLALANLVVVQYGRGAIQSALEQGGRAGALSGSPADCESVALDVVDQLLGGSMSDGLVVACGVEAGLMVARASAVFETWTPLAPDFPILLSSQTVMERLP